MNPFSESQAEQTVYDVLQERGFLEQVTDEVGSESC